MHSTVCIFSHRFFYAEAELSLTYTAKFMLRTDPSCQLSRSCYQRTLQIIAMRRGKVSAGFWSRYCRLLTPEMLLFEPIMSIPFAWGPQLRPTRSWSEQALVLPSW